MLSGETQLHALPPYHNKKKGNIKYFIPLSGNRIHNPSRLKSLDRPRLKINSKYSIKSNLMFISVEPTNERNEPTTITFTVRRCTTTLRQSQRTIIRFIFNEGVSRQQSLFKFRDYYLYAKKDLGYHVVFELLMGIKSYCTRLYRTLLFDKIPSMFYVTAYQKNNKF